MFKIEKLDLLIGLYIFCICVSELMGGKTFAILTIPGINFPLNASVAVFVLPIIYSVNDVITEVLGAERARSVVRTGLVTVAAIFLFSFLATILPPSVRYSATEPAYDAIFQTTTRIAAASLTAFAISDLMDVAIFVKLRQKLGKKGLWLRNNLSNFISQFFDSFFFIFLAFYAFDKSLQDNVIFLFGLIIPYWLLKCFMSVIETPLVYIGVNWLKGKQSV